MGGVVAKNYKVVFKWLWILVAALIIIIGGVAPDWPGLSHEGKMAILVLVAAVVMWATEALPLPITALAAMALIPMLGVQSLSAAWTSACNSSIMFFVGVFGFTTFLGSATFPQRLIAKVLKAAKGKSSLVLLGFMVVCMVISICMSNIALTAIMLGFAATVLEADRAVPGKSNLGRCFSMAIPFAVMIGGSLLPSGTPINVVVIGLIEDNLGVTVTFTNWFIVMVIPCILSLIATWFICIKVYKPEDISAEAVEAFCKTVDEMPKMEAKEWFNIAIIIVSIILWILSSWITVLNTTVIALFALALLFLPGTSMITASDYAHKSPWDILMMMMAVNSIVAGISAQSAAIWIVNTLLGGLTTMPFIAMFVIASLLLAIIHNFIPPGPPLAALVTMPFVGLAVAQAGGDMNTGMITAMSLSVAIWCAWCFLVPLDSVLLVSYSYGYFRFGEMAKSGAPITVALLVITCILLPMTCGFMGLP